MKITFRWYGEGNDSVTLNQIRQIPNCTGVMGVLDYKAAGEVWNKDEIADYVKHINDNGLEVEVIESVNVHEDIKMGLDTRDKYIENYITTIKNLAEYGIKVIVYNFMPVFDWLRTDLAYPIGDGSTALYYNNEDLEGMTPKSIVEDTIKNCNGFTLPGWEPDRLGELERTLEIYKTIDENKLRENYKYFLEKIIPTCEEVGVKMAVHPDDPAWNLFGLPRISHSLSDFEHIVNMVDSPSNCICLCSGSLGSSPDNNIPEIIRHFGSKNKIACAHIRNVKYLGEKCFRESSHLSKDGSLDMFEIVKAIFETCPNIFIRPDHGRMIWDEKARPGYGLYDRALGIAYINGLWEALEKTNK